MPVRSRSVLFVLLAITAAVIVFVVLPFASALFMAAVLASTFQPWMDRLSQRLGGRKHLAAGVLTLGVVVALVIPLVTFGVIIVQEARSAIISVRATLETEGVEGLIHRLPPPIDRWADTVWQQIPDRQETSALIFEAEKRAAATIPRLVTGTTGAIGQVALMVVALFFLLLDGDQLLRWVDVVSPLRRAQLLELFSEFRRVSKAVLLGSFVTAAMQALVALAGYAIANVPNLLFCTLLTFLIGLIPLLGAAVVTFAIAIYLFLTGHTGSAIFLSIWAVAVVGVIDNVLRPWLLKDGIALHGAIVFFALLGGFAAFGMAGLILGPLSVSFFLALLRMIRREDRLENAETEAASAN